MRKTFKKTYPTIFAKDSNGDKFLKSDKWDALKKCILLVKIQITSTATVWSIIGVAARHLEKLRGVHER